MAFSFPFPYVLSLVYNITQIIYVFLDRFRFPWCCFAGRSWLAVQHKGQVRAYLVLVQGQVGKDISQLQACGHCWRQTTGLQVWLVDEEENGN